MPTLGEIERAHGLPTDLLARVAFQECSWRSLVIDGLVKSSAGAVGMFQLLPRFFPDAGESWQQDAATAAQYLARLYDQFHDWQLALAAYNWGPMNLEHRLRDPSIALPSETARYVEEVSVDTGITGALV